MGNLERVGFIPVGNAGMIHDIWISLVANDDVNPELCRKYLRSKNMPRKLDAEGLKDNEMNHCLKSP